MPRTAIAVVGAGVCGEDVSGVAYEIGRGIAERGGIVVTGGLTGVMEAASRGARDAGGLVVGILPGRDPSVANESVDVAIPTGMGQLRNGLIVNSARALIALGGEWGTLSEIALALKLGVPVVGLGTWDLAQQGMPGDAIVRVSTAEEAVDQAFSHRLDGE